MELLNVRIDKPEEINFILGQAHFIKTVEDLHEALVGAVPGITFGLAFCEASGKCLVRWTGTDRAMIELAKTNALVIGAGHSFLIFFGKELYPLNVLNAVKTVPEVCSIFCATAKRSGDHPRGDGARPRDPRSGGCALRQRAPATRTSRGEGIFCGRSATNFDSYGLATDLQIASEPARPAEPPSDERGCLDRVDQKKLDTLAKSAIEPELPKEVIVRVGTAFDHHQCRPRLSDRCDRDYDPRLYRL
ncbi:MAG TPA: adenosine-specific kinase [Terrimicrobiaceae bacterium]